MKLYVALLALVAAVLVSIADADQSLKSPTIIDNEGLSSLQETLQSDARHSRRIVRNPLDIIKPAHRIPGQSPAEAARRNHEADVIVTRRAIANEKSRILSLLLQLHLNRPRYHAEIERINRLLDNVTRDPSTSIHDQLELLRQIQLREPVPVNANTGRATQYLIPQTPRRSNAVNTASTAPGTPAPRTRSLSPSRTRERTPSRTRQRTITAK